MLNIIYASFHCSERMFEQLFKDSNQKPGQAVQKYNRLLAEGLAKQKDVRVTSICELPITSDSYASVFFHKATEADNGINYHYIPLVNIHRIKDLMAVLATFWTCIRKSIHQETLFVSDILNAPVALGAFFAAKVCGKKYFAVVTDAPQFVYFDSDKAYRVVSNYLIKKASGYIFLTKQMNELFNQGNKPNIIIEGLVDANIVMSNEHLGGLQDSEKKVLMYSGSIHEKYGIRNLVEGFINADIESTELHIYGDGDYREELKEACIHCTKVKYYGSVMNSEVTERQRHATMLINPRPTTDEFTKYSFPSKNMEYMVSGVPLLTTNLPGMPEEYRKYVYLLEDETSSGITEKILELLDLGDEELRKKGNKAKEFVLEKKNNVIQAGMVVAMYNNMSK